MYTATHISSVPKMKACVIVMRRGTSIDNYNNKYDEDGGGGSSSSGDKDGDETGNTTTFGGGVSSKCLHEEDRRI